jgi:hypothetical protein
VSARSAVWVFFPRQSYSRDSLSNLVMAPPKGYYRPMQIAAARLYLGIMAAVQDPSLRYPDGAYMELIGAAAKKLQVELRAAHAQGYRVWVPAPFNPFPAELNWTTIEAEMKHATKKGPVVPGWVEQYSDEVNADPFWPLVAHGEPDAAMDVDAPQPQPNPPTTAPPPQPNPPTTAPPPPPPNPPTSGVDALTTQFARTMTPGRQSAPPPAQPVPRVSAPPEPISAAPPLPLPSAPLEPTRAASPVPPLSAPPQPILAAPPVPLASPPPVPLPPTGANPAPDAGPQSTMPPLEPNAPAPPAEPIGGTASSLPADGQASAAPPAAPKDPFTLRQALIDHQERREKLIARQKATDENDEAALARIQAYVPFKLHRYFKQLAAMPAGYNYIVLGLDELDPASAVLGGKRTKHRGKRDTSQKAWVAVCDQ